MVLPHRLGFGFGVRFGLGFSMGLEGKPKQTATEPFLTGKKMPWLTRREKNTVCGDPLPVHSLVAEFAFFILGRLRRRQPKPKTLTRFHVVTETVFRFLWVVFFYPQPDVQTATKPTFLIFALLCPVRVR